MCEHGFISMLSNLLQTDSMVVGLISGWPGADIDGRASGRGGGKRVITRQIDNSIFASNSFGLWVVLSVVNVVFRSLVWRSGGRQCLRDGGGFGAVRLCADGCAVCGSGAAMATARL